MLTLSFDTSLDKTYVTLSENDKILSDVIVENHDEKYHSAYLIPTIVSILKEHNMTMKDIDAIGTNIGPGSFTGIRACVTAARVIAQQLNLPLVGISSLEILSRINSTLSKTLVVLDARKKQFYTAVYEGGREIKAPALTDTNDLKNFDFSNTFVISDTASAVFLKDNCSVQANIYTDINADLGKFLNSIVYEKLQKFSPEEFLWGKLKPLYLQTPPVTISNKQKILK